MAAAFLDAPQIEEIASKILGNHHTHLAGARIKYIFREGAWSKGGMACKVNSRDKYLHGYDFLIIINKEFYDALDAVSKKALIDHELSHCGMNG